MIKTEEPQLAKPGAGLPFIEWAVANYIMIPRMRKDGTKESAISQFSKESENILNLASGLTPEQRVERKLIKRLQGLEDSSRYWSVAMTMQHLIIVGGGMEHIITDLCKDGKSNRPKAQTAAVKPSPDVDGELIQDEFRKMSERFLSNAHAVNIDAHPKATFDHPWFGAFNAKAWLLLAGQHQRIHRKQIEAIIAQLSP